VTESGAGGPSSSTMEPFEPPPGFLDDIPGYDSITFDDSKSDFNQTTSMGLSNRDVNACFFKVDFGFTGFHRNVYFKSS